MVQHKQKLFYHKTLTTPPHQIRLEDNICSLVPFFWESVTSVVWSCARLSVGDVANSVTLYSFMSIVIRSRALGNERLTGTLSTVGHRFQGLG